MVTDLGTLGGIESWAYGLNNLGHVVGWAELPAGNYHAFVHDGGEMIDLGTLGGMFSSAYAINDEGVIVGYAQDASGQWQAVRWVPVPEPATWSLAIMALGCRTLHRRRRVANFANPIPGNTCI
jgi:probable HAF family extracellular repeat protein